MYDQLAEAPLTFDLEGQMLAITPDVYAFLVFDNLYAVSYISLMPAAVDSLANGEADNPYVLGVLGRAFPPAGIAWLMHYATVCSEDPLTSPEDARSLDGELAGLIESYIEDDTSSYIELCSYMGLPVFPDETDDAPIESDIPVLILSGGFDPITPEEFALSIQDTLTTSYAYTMPYGAHVQLLGGEPCASEIATQFIADPLTEPDASCIADAEPIGFPLPEDEG